MTDERMCSPSTGPAAREQGGRAAYPSGGRELFALDVSQWCCHVSSPRLRDPRRRTPLRYAMHIVLRLLGEMEKTSLLIVLVL